jgi:hypothetical protein
MATIAMARRAFEYRIDVAVFARNELMHTLQGKARRHVVEVVYEGIYRPSMRNDAEPQQQRQEKPRQITANYVVTTI